MCIQLVTVLSLLASATAVHAQQPNRTTATPAHEAATPVVGAKPLSSARSWAYQLQKALPAQIAASPFDMVVIDYSRNGTNEKRFTPSDLKWMKRKPNGEQRIVLAYLSVGEAEDYRFYWDEKWIEVAAPDEPPASGQSGAVRAAGEAPPPANAGQPTIPAPAGATSAPPAPADAAVPPAKPARPDRWISASAPVWLGDENEKWSGNFEVKYWEKGWQDIIFGTPNSYLEKIVAAGFDGIYLDRVDAYYEFQDVRDTAADEMVDFVVRLAAHARKLRPGFLVVPQNGEELLLKRAYLDAIDAIAKEDLFFGGPGNGEPNHPAVIANSLGWLSQTTMRKLPVFVVEYLDKPAQIAEARAMLDARGYVSYFGVRELDRLVSPLPAGKMNATMASPTKQNSPAKQKQGR